MDANILLIAAGAAGAVLIAAVVWAVMTWRRRRALRDEFGTEYDRAVERADSRREAHEELRARKERHEELDLRELDAEQVERLRERWRAVRADFVDSPTDAVERAETIVREAMQARGYPQTDFEQRAADLSVAHPDEVEHYRRGVATARRSETNGKRDTEDLRQALLHLGEMLEALVDAGSQRHMEEAA